MKRALSTALVAAALIHAAGTRISAQAPIPDGPLNYFNSSFVTGDVVVGGRQPVPEGAANGFASQNINISGVPAGAEILSAYLYIQTTTRESLGEDAGIAGAKFKGNSLNTTVGPIAPGRSPRRSIGPTAPRRAGATAGTRDGGWSPTVPTSCGSSRSIPAPANTSPMATTWCRWPTPDASALSTTMPRTPGDDRPARGRREPGADLPQPRTPTTAAALDRHLRRRRDQAQPPRRSRSGFRASTRPTAQSRRQDDAHRRRRPAALLGKGAVRRADLRANPYIGRRSPLGQPDLRPRERR